MAMRESTHLNFLIVPMVYFSDSLENTNWIDIRNKIII